MIWYNVFFVFFSNQKASFYLTMTLRVTPSFAYLIDQAVSACFMPIARHFQEVGIKYDTSILKRKSVVKHLLLYEIDLCLRSQPEMISCICFPSYVQYNKISKIWLLLVTFLVLI